MKKFFKKFTLKIKVAVGFIFAIASLILYFSIKGKIRAKNTLEYELDKTRKEIEIAQLEEKTEENLKKLDELKATESDLRLKIEAVKKEEIIRGEDISLDELDDFFDSRGF